MCCARRRRMRRIASLDVSAAKAAPGVLLVVTAAEFDAAMPCLIPITNRDGSERADPKHPILCKDEVNYVGDHVAFVVAETRIQAKDAAELIEVEYEDLPAVADTARALGAGCGPGPSRGPGQPRLRLALWRRGGRAGGVRQGRQGGRARADQQPRDLQRHGAARLRGRVERRRRQAHRADLHPGRLGPPRHPRRQSRPASPSRCG